MKLADIAMLFQPPKLSYRVWKVWMRDRDVFMKTYKTGFLPPLLEPVLYLLALGFGLGGFVQPINGEPYIQFIAPALVAVSMMFSAFYECTFGSFVRMYFQKTFDAIIATPVNIDEIITGELLLGLNKEPHQFFNSYRRHSCLPSDPKSHVSADSADLFPRRITVLILSHVLYGHLSKHRIIQLPQLSFHNAHVSIKRNLLPIDQYARFSAGGCLNFSTPN